MLKSAKREEFIVSFSSGKSFIFQSQDEATARVWAGTAALRVDAADASPSFWHPPLTPPRLRIPSRRLSRLPPAPGERPGRAAMTGCLAETIDHFSTVRDRRLAETAEITSHPGPTQKDCTTEDKTSEIRCFEELCQSCLACLDKELSRRDRSGYHFSITS